MNIDQKNLITVSYRFKTRLYNYQLEKVILNIRPKIKTRNRQKNYSLLVIGRVTFHLALYFKQFSYEFKTQFWYF